MQAIGGHQTPPQSLFVGGAVRNILMGVPPGDVDIATILTPDIVSTRLLGHEIKAVPTGLDHGTITAVAEGVPYEITTLRHDVVTDGRRAVVSFTDDWAADAARRDFTVNALYADIDGNIYDPTGQGMTDLTARRVRFVGNAEQRVAEDYLRILRFFRFNLYYGQGEVDAEALKACRAAANNISRLSRERVTHEFLKILSHDHPAPIISMMLENGVMGDLPSPHYSPEVMARVAGTDFIPRLFVLSALHDRDLSRWLVLSNRQKKDLKNLEAAWVFLSDRTACSQTIKEMMYRFGRDATRRAYQIVCAVQKQAQDKEIQNLIEDGVIPVFPVTGELLISQGMKPGAELGRRLKTLEEEWIARGFVNKN